jgi:hypothetical protein
MPGKIQPLDEKKTFFYPDTPGETKILPVMGQATFVSG